jgi:hypothetical protein
MTDYTPNPDCLKRAFAEIRAILMNCKDDPADMSEALFDVSETAKSGRMAWRAEINDARKRDIDNLRRMVDHD